MKGPSAIYWHGGPWDRDRAELHRRARVARAAALREDEEIMRIKDLVPDIRTVDTPEKTEADKEVEGKERWDLEFHYAFDDIIAVMTYGAEKYAPRNWEKGMPWRRALGALMRHIRKFRSGKTMDLESGLPHMAHAAWWCCALLDWMRTHPEFDDRLGTQGQMPLRVVGGQRLPDTTTAATLRLRGHRTEADAVEEPK